MKKLLCVLVCVCVMLTSAFATDWSDTVLIHSTVGKISLSEAAIEASKNGTLLYKLYGGLDNPESASLDDIVAGDVSENDVEVWFRIHQPVKVKTNELIRLSVTATKLSLSATDALERLAEDPDAIVETAFPILSDVKGFSSSWLTVSNLVSGNTVAFDLQYTDDTHSVEDVNIAQFKGTWKKLPTLANGSYTASVILGYTTN